MKAASSVMKSVAPSLARERAERAGELGGQREATGVAAVGLGRRARAVGGQLERGERRRAGAPSSRAGAASTLALEPVALPGGEVGVLDRELGERRGLAAARRRA